MVGIKTESERKYRILAAYKRRGHAINFDVVYYAKEKRYNAITEEIGAKEGELIRRFLPLLNTQIPKAENWRKYTCREIDSEIL